jgi:hypothetical protein
VTTNAAGALRPVGNTTAITCFIFAGAARSQKKPYLNASKTACRWGANRAVGERVRALTADVIERGNRNPRLGSSLRPARWTPAALVMPVFG